MNLNEQNEKQCLRKSSLLDDSGRLSLLQVYQWMVKNTQKSCNEEIVVWPRFLNILLPSRPCWRPGISLATPVSASMLLVLTQVRTGACASVWWASRNKELNLKTRVWHISISTYHQAQPNIILDPSKQTRPKNSWVRLSLIINVRPVSLNRIHRNSRLN